MVTIQNHAGIIDTLLSSAVPNDFIPYNMLLMFAMAFGIATWLASLSLKQLRHKEFELEQKIKVFERQHKRDMDLIQDLTEQIGNLINPDEDVDEAINSS